MEIFCMTQGTEMGVWSRREGTWVYVWLVLIDVRQKTTKFSKAIILQFKKNLKKRKWGEMSEEKISRSNDFH